jgi:glycerophosphoryl diester phosphodiesterase
MKNPLIVAHRGASYSAPENTLPAFKLAFEEQADFIEGDFWLTRDNQIVCIHDVNTKRVTKQNVKLDVRKVTLADLKKLDVGSWKDDKYLDTTIPTLQEILNRIPDGKGIFIEIKDIREIFVLKLIDELNRISFPVQKIRIISFSKKTIKLVKEKLPQIKVYWLFGWYFSKSSIFKSVAQKRILESLKSINCDGVDLFYAPYLDKNLVNLIKSKELDLCVFNVENIEAAKKLRDYDVDFITTNYPLMIRKAIKNDL